MKLSICFLLLMTLLVSACSGAVEPPVASVLATIAEPNVSEPTFAATELRPTATMTATAEPLTPTVTLEPPPSPTTIASPTPESNVAATFEAIAPVVPVGEYLSPDGRLRAEALHYDCALLPPPEGDGEPYEQAYETFYLVAEDGSRVLFADQRQACGGLGAAGLEGYFWSEDGHYFYYGSAREGVVDGCGFFSTPFYRLDTGDLTTTYLGYGPVSPDGSMLALWTDDSALVIYAVSGDLLAHITNSGTNPIPSTIAWSPDSRALVYVLTEGYCPEGASTLMRLDMPDLEPMVLREDDPGYANVIWLSTDRLQLDNSIGDSSLTIDAADGTIP